MQPLRGVSVGLSEQLAAEQDRGRGPVTSYVILSRVPLGREGMVSCAMRRNRVKNEGDDLSGVRTGSSGTIQKNHAIDEKFRFFSVTLYRFLREFLKPQCQTSFASHRPNAARGPKRRRRSRHLGVDAQRKTHLSRGCSSYH